MLKLVRRLVFLCVVLAIGGVALALALDGLIATGIEKGGTYAVGVPVTAGATTIGLTTGALTIADLRIANPPGFSVEPFFAMQKLATTIPVKDLLGDRIEIQKIEISGVKISLEQTITQSNWQVITANLAKFESGGKPKEQAGGKRVVIKELVLSDLEVGLVAVVPVAGAAGKQSICLPPIRLRDVGAQGGQGALVGDVAGVVVLAVLDAVAKDGGGLLGPSAVANLEGTVRELATGSVGIGDALESMKKDPAKAAQGIQNLLGGKKK